jgi:DNA-binding MarR family transcriptional regulator
MATASDLPTDRQAIGQLLVRLLYRFRQELLSVAADGGYPDIRTPHLQIFGNLGIDGIRLTDLAARAQLSLAATSEFVTDLQQLGYLERRPDPADGRAKLIFPTPRGRQALDDAGDRVAEIEHDWSTLVGRTQFDQACRTLQDLLDQLDQTHPEGARP